MVELGYALSSEEHQPNDLVDFARRAEDAGFSFAMISDHFHPWIDAQGQSPFVWSVLGGIARATTKIRVGTGVTCPTIRVHPAIVAQAAATVGAMMPGRFFLGVGTGENLNEHVVGERWPSANERRDMLEEAIAVIRELWQGGLRSYEGRYYRAIDARLYTLPEDPIDLMVAAAGEMSAELAGRAGDGLITTASDPKLLAAFDEAGGSGKPRIGQYVCCWAASEEEARKTAHSIWPLAAIHGDMQQELPLPRHFEQASSLVTPDDVAMSILCGPDPEPHLAKIRELTEAGFSHIYVHQVGHDQEGFFRFFADEVMPNVSAS